ncbi:MAG: type VI secretion system tube protein Hcp [Ectothiorhodospiraceae bacterium]|nr:type VI secretion system tube protein Hcp [Ectothiorhodospiraceae bacterium]MCH8506592.1 type VI secretion system tube protein Hcp [Ectothiorhodospiraceae bacterium]
MSIHLQYGEIRGESADLDHECWIDCETLSWGTLRRITSHSSTRNDRESANAEFTTLTLLRRTDSASPYLILEACCGQAKDAILHLTKTGEGGGAATFAEYRLRDAYVSCYQVLATAYGTARPVEMLVLSFSAVELRYTPFNDKGLPMPPNATGFDIRTNRRL